MRLRDAGSGYAPAIDESVKAPHWGMLAMEGRSLLEFAAFVFSLPFLHVSERGDGHPVLVLPPFGTGDIYTQPLRWLLTHLGYDVHGWDLGPNLGMTHDVRDRLPRRLLEISERSGRRVSIVGWSAGGILER